MCGRSLIIAGTLSLKPGAESSTSVQICLVCSALQSWQKKQTSITVRIFFDEAEGTVASDDGVVEIQKQTNIDFYELCTLVETQPSMRFRQSQPGGNPRLNLLQKLHFNFYSTNISLTNSFCCRRPKKRRAKCSNWFKLTWATGKWRRSKAWHLRSSPRDGRVQVSDEKNW